MAGDRTDRTPRALWVIALAVLGLVNFFAFATTRGWCADAASPGIESDCGSEQMLGWPATWVLAVLSVIAAGYFVWRLIRPR